MATGESEPLHSQRLRYLRRQKAGKPLNAQTRKPQIPHQMMDMTFWLPQDEAALGVYRTLQSFRPLCTAFCSGPPSAYCRAAIFLCALGAGGISVLTEILHNWFSTPLYPGCRRIFDRRMFGHGARPCCIMRPKGWHGALPDLGWIAPITHSCQRPLPRAQIPPNNASTAICHPGTAGSASAISPRRKITGRSGSLAL